MTEKPHGRFVVIEGIDGAGTTTQAQLLVERLNREGRSAVFTGEPTDGPVGSLIRQMLHRRVVRPLAGERFAAIDPATLALLFSADRLDHNAQLIAPAVEAGRVVVCDRYDYSTLAYQGVHVDLDWIIDANRLARRPDLAIYLRVDPRAALARLGGRADLSIFEKADFLEKVTAIYDRLFAAETNAVTLDGSKPVDKIAAEIWRVVSGILE
ncbi:MAG: dTMP kinase [Myxococcales bacterium]|nr:MAG: dTMP kinase [Myxococcales bacterium]